MVILYFYQRQVIEVLEYRQSLEMMDIIGVLHLMKPSPNMHIIFILIGGFSTLNKRR